MANQLKGEGTKSNLRDWAEYAKRNSYDQSESKAQSKRDLAPVEKFVAEEVTQAIGKWCPTRPNLKGGDSSTGPNQAKPTATPARVAQSETNPTKAAPYPQ